MKALGSLGERVASAAVAVALMGSVGWFFAAQGLMFLCLAVAIVVSFEFSWLIVAANSLFAHRPLCIWLFRFLSVLLCFVVVFFNPWAIAGLSFCMAMMALATFVSLTREEELERALQQLAWTTIGFIYCGILAGSVILLLRLPEGIRIFVAFLAIVFAGDTLAYFCGKTWGRRKLVALISPKKTVAGAWGGIAGSLAAAVLSGIYFMPSWPWYWWLALGLVTGGLAQIGDIFESLLKRVAQVKDSGQLMPGHGGLMDRVDGVYFAAPVFYLVARSLSIMF